VAETLVAAIERAARLLATARSVAVSTGAGMSRESGIPIFREAPGALWAQYDPDTLATREGFRRDPAMVWRWYAERRAMIARAAPHEGHAALAGMEPLFEDFLLVTQNIDALHERAGSRRLVELHGNIFRFKCFDRDHPAGPPVDDPEVPPRCECGSFLRPDVVWFGEPLPEDEMERAYAAIVSCNVLLLVGTSGLVYPAAGLPAVARDCGARIIEVNPEETPQTELADVVIRAGARDVLPGIAARVARARKA
jgi:NAD-dependent deacetylase